MVIYDKHTILNLNFQKVLRNVTDGMISTDLAIKSNMKNESYFYNIISYLVEHKLIEKEGMETNKRSYIVRLTPKGLKTQLLIAYINTIMDDVEIEIPKESNK